MHPEGSSKLVDTGVDNDKCVALSGADGLICTPNEDAICSFAHRDQSISQKKNSLNLNLISQT